MLNHYLDFVEISRSSDFGWFLMDFDEVFFLILKVFEDVLVKGSDLGDVINIHYHIHVFKLKYSLLCICIISVCLKYITNPISLL